MKKLLLLLAIILVSCTPEQTETPQEALNCSCGKVVQVNNFTSVNGVFQVIIVRNNCNQVDTQRTVSGNSLHVGSDYCL